MQDSGNSESEGVAGKAAPSVNDETFYHLSLYLVSLSSELRARMARIKSTLLTIMSFCFIGMVTFTAANTEPITKDCLSMLFFVIAFILWFIAFGFTLLKYQGDGYYVIPGQDEILSFMPSAREREAFYKSKDNPDDADEFFMRKYFARDHTTVLAAGFMPYKAMVAMFNEKISKLTPLDGFNQNAWLASLNYMCIGMVKNLRNAEKHYRRMRYLFVSSILAFVAGVTALWF